MKTPAQVLREAAALVEKGHCKQAYAENAYGISCSARDPEAQAWCALGAIVCAAGGHPNADAAMRVLQNALPAEAYIDTWNDAPERTAAEVAAAMRKAAENLESHQ